MSEYYSQYLTGQSSRWIKDFQEGLDRLNHSDQDAVDHYLMKCVSELSLINVNKNGRGSLSFDNIEGGPFAALIVDYGEPGVPRIVGLGTNHVVLESDPSSHGEMSAIRDAMHRLGDLDLSGMQMYSSCECCPQCQAAITSVGIHRLLFANSRFEAADIGFSDEEQYRLVENMSHSMMPINESHLTQTFLSLLGDYDAVVLDQDHNVIAHNAEHNDSIDAFARLPSLSAILMACKKLNVFHLPEGAILISRKKPHPIAFVTADWSRLGRIRGMSNKDDPSCDLFEKDKSCILYLDDHFEELDVSGPNEAENVLVSAEDVLADVVRPQKSRIHVQTQRINDLDVLVCAKKAFDQWSMIVSKDNQLKY